MAGLESFDDSMRMLQSSGCAVDLRMAALIQDTIYDIFTEPGALCVNSHPTDL